MLLNTSSNWCIGLFENYLQIRFKDPNLEAVRNSSTFLHSSLYIPLLHSPAGECGPGLGCVS